MIIFTRLKGVGRTALIFTVLLVSLGSAASVGTFVTYTQTGDTINVTVSNGYVRVNVIDTNAMRVSFDTRTSNTFTSADDVLSMSDQTRHIDYTGPLTVTNSASNLDIATGSLTCRISKGSTYIAIYWLDGSGNQLTRDAAAMNNTGTSSGTPSITLYSAIPEQYYGWGAGFEHFANANYPINKKGLTYDCHRSMAHFMFSTGTGRGYSYGIWPIFQEEYSYGWGPISGCRAGCGFRITSTGSAAGIASFFQSSNTGWSMDYLSYYFFKGDWKTVMGAYTLVSGRPPRQGKKYYGIARDMYPGVGGRIDISRVAAWPTTIRTKKINMDWHKMDNFFDWTNLCYATIPNTCWNTGLPAAIIKYGDSGLLFGGMSRGWGYGGCCSSGCTNYQCQTLAQAQYAISYGYDWAWYDAMNYISRQHNKEMWNTWVQAHNTRDALDGNGEIKTMISLGWQALSNQSWPSGHMGDYLTTYPYRVFTSMLDEALVGHPVSHCDLGEGQTSDEWGYAGYYLRPMIAIHQAGAAGNTRTDFPASIDVIELYSGNGLNHIKEWGNKHYRFIPYLFTYGMVAHETGVPIWRGMMCQDGGEWNSSTFNLSMQTYVGDNIIFAPAYNNAGVGSITSRTNIYIPSGTWYDFWLDGGQPQVSWTGPTTISAYNVAPSSGFREPTFVRAGAIIPLMDSLQYIGEKPETCLEINLYPLGGGSSNSFTLFEDEGLAAWNSTYAWCESNYTTQPVKTSISYTMDASNNITVTFGAMSGTSRYCSGGPSTRRYQVALRGLTGWTAGYAWQRPGTSGSWTSLPAINVAQYATHTPGLYFASANGGTLLAHHTTAVNGSSTFQMYFSQSPMAGTLSSLPVALAREVTVRLVAGAVEIRVPFAGGHTVEVLNMQGRVIARRAGGSAANYLISLDGNASTMYLVRVSGQGQSMVRKVIL